jgi:NAD(P)-dependent dehydrogenase (short-subunit alcohol dehydrogenase family)
MHELKDKVAIVTGASRPRGIGHAIARRFAQAGASVLLVADATADQLAAAVQECRALPGAGRIESALIDLGRPGAPEEMTAQAERLFGRIDVLVNNAAIRASVDFGEYTRDQFDRVVAVNLAAPFFASQAVLPIMRRQGGGRILHMASQLGHVTFAQLARDNIIVNAISPGPIATGPILANDPEVTRRRVEQYVPAGRLGEPEEIADLALYLAASSPPYLRGQDIVIDGGYIIH